MFRESRKWEVLYIYRVFTMDKISQRIKNKALRKCMCSPEDAADFIKDGMVVATSGNTLLGYPKAVFLALVNRIKNGDEIKIDLLSTGPLGPEIEDALVEVGGIRKRIGTVGSKLLRDAINRREVTFIEGKSGRLTQYARQGYYGPIDVAIIEASGINEEGNIIPATSVYDAPDWIELASAVIIEISLLMPMEIEGMHDIYYPIEKHCIPLRDPFERLGNPYIPLDSKKVKGIVFSQIEDREPPADRYNERSVQIAKNICDFLRREKNKGGRKNALPPLEVGIGNIMTCFLCFLVNTEFAALSFYLAAATDPILDLIDADKIKGISCNSLRFSRAALSKFISNLDKYKSCIIIRPVTITNSAEIINRLGIIAINSCLEADITGQINSSHLMGSNLVGGIAGSYDYSRSSAISIFALASTSKGGKISNILPQVSHVDHTEHEVDVIVTEHGYADLRAIDPYKRAFEIIDRCADPNFRDYLTAYVNKSMNNPGRIPILLPKQNIIQ